MFGDSLAQGFAYGVRQAVLQRGDHLADARVSEDVRIGIGLIPRRGLDPAVEIAGVLAAAQPPYDAVIVSLGVNDVGMPLGPVAFYGTAWQDAYRARLTAFADAVAARGTPLAWIQVPAVRPPAFAGPLDATIRGLQDAVMAAHPNVVLVDTASLTGTGSTFQTDMVASDGASVRLRTGDGIHFTAAGYVEVARRALDALAPRIAPPLAEPQPAAVAVEIAPPPVVLPPVVLPPAVPLPAVPLPVPVQPAVAPQPVVTERPIGVERPVAVTPGAPLPLVPVQVNPVGTGGLRTPLVDHQ
ncbi:MAG: DUF459 domain-containing protein [Rhodospirillaceae bacterium]|nr:DUF459 domain-containing protein [Rhodospirillaceae bacterium]